MNTEGEYAESKYLKFHRWASVILVMTGTVFYAQRFGLALTIRPFASFILPIALIWFSDQLAGWAIQDSGGWLNATNADGFVRLIGWLVLAILIGIRAMIYLAL